jgi:hypothetical protein
LDRRSTDGLAADWRRWTRIERVFAVVLVTALSLILLMMFRYSV